MTGPLILYFRHYSNLWQMAPKILLIVISLPILAGDILSAIDPKGEVFGWIPRLSQGTNDACSKVGGILAMTGWLIAQIVTDIAIVITRAKRHSLTKPIVRAFFKGEGVEAAAMLWKLLANGVPVAPWPCDVSAGQTPLCQSGQHSQRKK